MTTKSAPSKAQPPTNAPPTEPPADDTDTSNTSVHETDSDRTAGDLYTVLRHLVSNQQWGGNHGARSECEDALNRLADDLK